MWNLSVFFYSFLVVVFMIKFVFVIIYVIDCFYFEEGIDFFKNLFDNFIICCVVR